MHANRGDASNAPQQPRAVNSESPSLLSIDKYKAKELLYKQELKIQAAQTSKYYGFHESPPRQGALRPASVASISQRSVERIRPK
jgi:hypothetical protein